ncbi:hypothetical protein [Rhodococcus sp. T2V]|uniref:hypothetical protein n=1 Tax=Rhodococcus sp. T2V TaxID=3034164 RepID=UPI0023E11F1A|nr:hypothetical protein [Rhodococcus sp. T2V]MDF3312711.1 hypothetical protein [Rhodococcus sp. T2V]
MGVVTTARALGRLQYRLTRIPLDLFEGSVMPVFFDDGAPARLVFEWVLIECDNAAAVLFDDDSAAAHAQQLRQRSAAVRYARARRQRQILRDTDAAVLERHRALFRARHQQHTRGTE